MHHVVIEIPGFLLIGKDDEIGTWQRCCSKDNGRRRTVQPVYLNRPASLLKAFGKSRHSRMPGKERKNIGKLHNRDNEYSGKIPERNGANVEEWESLSM